MTLIQLKSFHKYAIFLFMVTFLIILLIIMLVSLVAVFIGVGIYNEKCNEKKKAAIREQITKLANNELEITPDEFFDIRKASFGRRGRPSYTLTKNFAGVYILHNKTKNMYYVGQGKEVLNRVNSHFTGKGNGDVYADYKYGDVFTIRMIGLAESGYATLNDLERDTILTYDAFAKGYNKTRGNR